MELRVSGPFVELLKMDEGYGYIAVATIDMNTGNIEQVGNNLIEPKHVFTDLSLEEARALLIGRHHSEMLELLDGVRSKLRRL